MNDADSRAAAGKAFRSGFSGVIRIAPEGGKPFDIDGRGPLCVIEEADPSREPDCTWRASGETLIRIFEGGRALESAYLSGRLSIVGDMSIMARLYLESSR